MSTDRRTELREAAFLLLFRADFYPKEDMAQQIRDFFEGEDSFSEKERQRVADKVMAVLEKQDEIDAELEKYSIGWKVRRMSKVDLTILRLAVYEMKYDEKVPVSSAINEAVELAKNYGEEHSPSFVNGILAKTAKNASAPAPTKEEEPSEEEPVSEKEPSEEEPASGLAAEVKNEG